MASKLALAVADFNEEHGITGLQIGNRSVSNEELRETTARDLQMETLIESLKGRTFRRPKGKQLYTIKGIEWMYLGKYPGARPQVICDTPTGERNISFKDLSNMVMVNAEAQD